MVKETLHLRFSEEQLDAFPNIYNLINQIVDEMLEPENMKNGLTFTNRLTDEDRDKIKQLHPMLTPQTVYDIDLVNPLLQHKQAFVNFKGELHRSGFWTFETIINYALGRMVFTDESEIKVPLPVKTQNWAAVYLIRWVLTHDVLGSNK